MYMYMYYRGVRLPLSPSHLRSLTHSMPRPSAPAAARQARRRQQCEEEQLLLLVYIYAHTAVYSHDAVYIHAHDHVYVHI